ncbi:LOW QUALITY PROTEIN: BAG family molecular chaperone regulator 4 [Parambassis ranga]|uniref:LOW QUALITY PROTEIN: BAG family molecular chaperone regulator 4 n=1 Tax=Parambassis ranga TaxID=210632 RepID=A0A6P7J3N5_9TELE|nr:LOW QUALITY PROTEIN: BAG family molecular chaperone regulator 4 [Parambassis ranga]
MHRYQMQSNLKPGWPSLVTRKTRNNHRNWKNTMDAPQYPGYSSQFWYPQSHSTGHYANTYPSGSEVQPQYNPQVMPGGYPNGHGVYSPAQNQYSTSGFHPSNPFYCADPQRPAPGSYPNQGCPAEQSSGPSGQPHSQHQHLHYPGPHCQGGPGYPPGPYPHYSEGGHAMPPNPPYPTVQSLHPSPQADAWAHSGPYAPSQQQWQPGQQPPQNHYPVRPPHPPAWPGTGTGAPPPYQPKDQQHQRAPPGVPKPRPAPSPNPSSGNPAEISSPPQIYNKTRRGDTNPSQAEPPPIAPSQAPAPAAGQTGPQPLSDNPSLAKVQYVMARVLLLQEDVDEFVGKKTDKTYRCLEELLTKELLELDSVETQGQENVRQARKEAVQKIQAILDKLEKKAF